MLLDLDGVLADLVAGLLERHGRPSPFSVESGVFGPSAWNFPQTVWGQSPDDTWSVCDRSFWAQLPKTKHADEIVALVADHVGARRVAICTALPSAVAADGAADGKLDWCRRHYPDLPVILTAEHSDVYATPPKHFLAHDGVILIDDNEANCRAFWNAGGLAMIWPAWWNSRWAVQGHAVGQLDSFLRCFA